MPFHFPSLSSFRRSLCSPLCLFLRLYLCLVGRWVLTLGIFLVWLVVEDLVRKLAGNNLAVYFVKDLIYFVLLFALFTSCILAAGVAAGDGPDTLASLRARLLGGHHGCADDRRRLALALGRTATRLSLRALGGGGLSLGSANL